MAIVLENPAMFLELREPACTYVAGVVSACADSKQRQHSNRREGKDIACLSPVDDL